MGIETKVKHFGPRWIASLTSDYLSFTVVLNVFLQAPHSTTNFLPPCPPWSVLKLRDLQDQPSKPNAQTREQAIQNFLHELQQVVNHIAQSDQQRGQASNQRVEGAEEGACGTG